MSQAKTLSDRELRSVLATIAQGRHAERNRAMVLTSFWAGMRVGEIAALRFGDVLAADGSIKDEVRLGSEQTKGSRGRLVILPDKLRKELAIYVRTRLYRDPLHPLFYSQRSKAGFSANTLCQQFGTIYRLAGLDDASSHSGRRTFITNLANKGVSVRVLAALAGHRNISTTQCYIDLDERMMKAAVNLS